MRILLDTHVWLWWLNEPSRLTPDAIDALRNGENEIYVSAASVWEIVVKHALGKLELPADPAKFLPRAMSDDGILGLPIVHAHALRIAGLPPHHRDPFDRMLIAQAQVEDMPILTADRVFQKYEVSVLNAR